MFPENDYNRIRKIVEGCKRNKCSCAEIINIKERPLTLIYHPVYVSLLLIG